MRNLSDVGIRCQCFADPVDDRLGDGRCPEPVGQADRIGAGDTTRRATCNKEVIGIRNAEFDHRINARVVIGKVIRARILVVQQHAERFAIAAAATMVVIEHDVAGCGHQLHLGGKVGPVGQRRSAMNLENQRMGGAFFITGRRDVPALDFLAVEL